MHRIHLFFIFYAFPSLSGLAIAMTTHTSSVHIAMPGFIEKKRMHPSETIIL